MSGDVGAEVAAVAEFLHERFAPEWVDHWRDLDDGQQRETPAWDMATTLAPLIAERVEAAKAEGYDNGYGEGYDDGYEDGHAAEAT